MLVIDNYTINESIEKIIHDVKRELTNGKLSFIENKGEYIRVTCPFHKGGAENRASASVYIGDDLPLGTFNCFTCHESGSFAKFIGGCFDQSEAFGKQWLISRYGESSGPVVNLEKINLNKKQVSEEILDESILNTFSDYHPYMKKRKLSEAIIKKFQIKYDPKTRSIVFPVRDLKGSLIGLTRRSVDIKRFDLPKFNNKPIYLLYNILQEKINHVWVFESQINALYAWGLGYPSIALFGTGSKYQYELLNKSGIRFFTLVFDGDEAGDKGAQNFVKNINKSCIIDVKKVPRGKDLNDLTEEEVKILLG